MAGSNMVIPNIEDELKSIDDQMADAERKAKKFIFLSDVADTRLYQALYGIYSVWKPLVNADHLIEPYCVRHHIKPNSTKRNNRFHAPVQVCFRDRPASITIYAITLQEAEREGIEPNDLLGWLKINRGPDAIYEKYREASRAAKSPISQPPITAQQPAGTQPLTQNPSGQPVQLPQPTPAVASGPAAQPLDPIQQLIRAYHLVGRLERQKDPDTESKKKSTHRSYLVRNVMLDGQLRCCVENVSSMRSFPTAQLALPFAWDLLGTREYVLSFKEAKRLEREFPHYQGWTASADVDALEISGPAGHRFIAPALSDMDTHLRHMGTPVGYGSPLSVSEAQAERFLRWNNDLSRAVQEGTTREKRRYRDQEASLQGVLKQIYQLSTRSNRQNGAFVMTVPRSSRHHSASLYEITKPNPVKFPKALDLEYVGSSIDADGNSIPPHISVSHLRTGLLPFVTLLDTLKCRLFDSDAPVAIYTDVRLGLLDIMRVCKVIRQGMGKGDARAQFVAMEEEQAGILFEIPLPNGDLRCIVPTIKSASLLPRLTCEPLVRT
jgi:hypothetical protein